MNSQVSMNGEKKLDSKKVEVTLRLDLSLAPPTDALTNEFSYVQLLKCKESSKAATGPSTLNDSALNDPLLDSGADDGNLAAIAKIFEEKYGPKKRKRMLHESDLIDRGLGYDLTDSFVDDSEMYENFVPHQVDTRFGGFYVNTGLLEFKRSEDLEDDDELDFVSLKKPKKPKVKKLPSFQSTPQAILANQKLKKAKQRAALQKHPTPLKKSQGVGLGGASVKPPPVKKLKLVIGKDQASQPSPSLLGGLDKATPTCPSSDAHSIIQTVNLSSKLSKGSGSGGKVAADSKSSVPGEGQQPAQQVPKEPPVIPDKLPSTVLEKVTNLEQLILKDQDVSGKLSVKIRMGYDEHLVDIRMSCHGLTKKMRNAVFEYLAYRMGVARGTLIKRINQELKKREDTELEKHIRALKQAIDASMPEQMELYEKEVKARAESMSSQAEVSVPVVEEDIKMDDVFDEGTNASVTQLSSSQPSADRTKKPPIRKRFKWTDETRKLLCTVVKIKVVYEERINKITKANAEDLIMTFLDEKIKILWPKGWMQKSVLYKASEAAHKHITNPLAKKVLPLKKDKPIPALPSKREPSPQIATILTQQQQAIPINTHPITTTTSVLQTPQITSDNTKTASLDKNFAPRKEVKLASESMMAGGGPLGIGVTKTIANVGSSASVVKSTAQMALQKSQQKAVGTRPVKPAYVKHPTPSNCRVAPPKSAKATSLSLGGGKSAAATYLLSTDIAQLLQAHLQQQSTAGGSIQLPVLTTAAQLKASSSSGAQLKANSSQFKANSTSGAQLKANSSSGAQLKANSSSGAQLKANSSLVAQLKANSSSVAQFMITSIVDSNKSKQPTVTGTPRLDQGVTVVSGTPVVVQAPKPLVSKDKGGVSPKAVATKPDGGMSHKLPRPSSLSTAVDTSRLESVVSKIVSAAIGSKSLSPVAKPALVSDDLPSPTTHTRLNLKKKAFASPQVIFPDVPHDLKATPNTTVGDAVGHASSSVVHATPTQTQSTTPLVPPIIPPSPTGRKSGCVSSTTTSGHVTINTPPITTGGHLLSSLHQVKEVALTPTLVAAQPPPGSTGSVKVIPDTPPQSLPCPITPQLVRPLGESPCSPASPLKSPVEQIFEEHSYV